ncbi:MAG: radical SAM protein [Erysipelotrichaceae bacterium]|nr:radical SAM protein [Erysipelotrichaceae bacterium]
MKKILLVRPEESRTRYNFKGIIENEPLDLEIIRQILKDRYDVTIFDLQVEPVSFAGFINEQSFDCVYIEGRCFQESFMIEYAGEFKERYGKTVIIGGQHAQINSERFMKDPVDYILSGYNYYDLPDIIEGNTEGIDNLSYKVDNEWRTNVRKSVDIRNLPWPDRSYFYEHKENYQYLDMKHSMWIRSSFACPYRCRFCIRRMMNDSKYSRRDVLDLVDEIEYNDNENVYLVDDDFLFDRNYVSTFIDEIKKRNIRRNYICYGRSDFISQNEDLMKDFRDIGLVYVLTGLEDIRDSKLDEYNKLNDVNNNLRCIEICRKYGIRLMAMFILGLDFTGKDFRDLYRFIERNDLKHVAVSIYTPELGTGTDYEYITDDASRFDYLHLVAKPTGMSVAGYYMHYYILLIKLFMKGRRDDVYDFLDYGYYIRTFIENIFRTGAGRNE